MAKRIIAAKVEQIIEFDSEHEANKYCEKMRENDFQFDLLDYGQIDDAKGTYRIRIVKSYNHNDLLISPLGLYNDPMD